MTRLQPVLSESEAELVEQVASITRTRKPEVVRNALALYSWFVRQAVTGARVIAVKPGGEEVGIETPELAALEGRAQRLSPQELGVLAKKLAGSRDAAEIGRLRERLARGFYGI